ncbi:hypothetical protein WA158_008340 [Blastocystis sp. Blastoise]
MSNYVSFDLGGTKLLMCYEYEGKRYTEKVPSGDDAGPKEIQKLVHDLLKKVPFKPKHIGMAVPGLIENGVLIRADNSPQMEGLSEEMLNIDGSIFHFINDGKAAIYAEAEHYPKDTSLIVFVVGTGLGCGIKSNGTFVDGDKGFSTEAGHIPMFIGNPDCENMEDSVQLSDDFVSGAALLKEMNCDAPTFHRLLEENDSKALSVIRKGGFFFGLVIASMINLFNPKHIVIGGSTATYKGYLERAKEIAQKYSLPNNWESVEFHDPFDLPRIVIDGAAAFGRTFE